MELSNTIVTGNTAISLHGSDIYGVVNSGDYNLISSTDSATLYGTHNITGQSAMIGPLQNNGGPTQTYALLAGSPAIDKGDPNFDPANAPNDQRGPGFPRVKNARVCIGAYESELDQGSNLVVNTLDDHDDGTAGASDCTLREAVRYGSPGANITFSVAGTITLTGGEMVIPKSLTISGPAAATGITVSGNNASRIFSVNQGTTGGSSTVNFSRLTLIGGNGAGGLSPGVGGALCSQPFTNSGILTMTVTDCSFSGNSANIGGAIRNSGTMTVTGSIFSGNSAINGGGAIQNAGPLTLRNITFSGNSATGIGSTDGVGGALRSGGNLTVTSCTFSGNTATLRGGAIDLTANAFTPVLSNTIVAGNTAPTGPDINGAIPTGGSNLIGKSEGSSGLTHGSNGNQVGSIATPLNPLLGTLADNGGPTQTFALSKNSPAVNAGNNALIPGAVTTDQRGFARVQATTVDIGAFEVDPVPPSVTINQAATQNDPTISTPLHFTIVFSRSVSNFTTGDVTLSGSAGATIATVSGSGSAYQVAVSGMARTGTVLATISANMALDASGYDNTASTSTDNSIYYSSEETVRNSGTITPVEGGGGGYDVGFIGNPGQEYTIQFSTDLAPGSWQTLGTQAGDSSGMISIIDNPPAGTPKRFYRMLLP